MALPVIELFCPDCKGDGDLWENPRLNYETTCKNCGHQWEYIELKEICHRLKQKEKENGNSNSCK
ncbi:hypothetical protein LCGC14_0659860 [marine sediment metagenome]|uniref:Uncharacterized protein n=1 Tax=marine sediment metagenome TaxID=412755 RepID=A0A0F9RDV4_9ZZZZ